MRYERAGGSGGGGGTWGSITGTLSAQTDLQAALDAKKTDSMATNKLLGRGTAGTGVIEEITLGTGLTLTGTTLDVTGGGGVSALAAIGSSPNANGATISGSTLNLEPASASFGGVVTTGAQTFAGAKTILDTLTHLQTASAGNTVVNGIELTNNTTASSGNQMYSGAVYWKGNGWRTGAGGVSTTCEFRSYILPVQSSGAAECTLNFEANQNGTGWVNVLQLRANSASYQVLAEFGTVALPSYSYRVDPDTGHRRSGVNAQAYVCGGADIFGIDVNGLCIGTLGMNNTNFGVHPTTTTKHGGLWRSRNSISVDYFNFQNDSATQEASLFRSSGTSGDWKWRMTGGTAALPSYSFYSDTDSGMFSGGANILGFSVNATEGARLTTTGLGVSLTNVRGKVHASHSVAGGTHASTVVVNNVNAGTGGLGTGPYTGIDFSHYLDSANDYQRKAAIGFEKITTLSRGDLVFSNDAVADDGNVNYLTDEVARITMAGNLGVGTIGQTVSARIHAIATTVQGRFGYDASNYFDIIVGSTGAVTLDAAGSGAGFTFSDSITMADAKDIILNTTTGTKIGTSTSQKLGFYNATPIVQGASVADASGGVVVDTEARTAINALISRIEALGLIATV